MNKKKLIKVLVLLVVAGALVTGVYAYMFRETATAVNDFIPAKVTCEVHETFDGINKSNVTVQNTGDIDAYIRLRIVTYWQDSKGVAVAKNSEPISITLSDQWIYDAADHTYYYKYPVAPGASTPILFSGSIVLDYEEKKENNIQFTYHQVVEFIAEAIQSEPDEAVRNSWNVTLDKDAQGKTYIKTVGD